MLLEVNQTMKMKTKLLLMLLLGSATLSQAQILDDDSGNPQVRARVQAARVAYITDRLGLTVEESRSFWALENEYDAAKEEVRKKYEPALRPEAMNDEQARAAIRDQLKKEEELLALKRTYFERFMQVVPPRKLAMFPKAEREFRLNLLRRAREQRGGRRFGN